MREVADDAWQSVRGCAAAAELPPLVQRLLALRGVVDAPEVDAFLNPRLSRLTAPETLPAMPEAVARLVRAIENNEPTVLYGDYDVDGVTSLAILTRVLAAAGLPVRPFLPHRTAEGYGLSAEGLRRCLEDGKPALIVAVDCGTSALAEIRWLREEEGIDVIVLDHHEPSPLGLPPAIVVNPKLGGTFHYLCTAGLAFKLSHALLKARPVPGFDLRDVLELVALGTVADVVPLLGENRLLVSKGLEQLARTRHPGLRALKRVAGVNGQCRSHHVGFRLGPRLNASGRLDTAQASLDLLLALDDGRATALAVQLDAQNRDRQALQARVEAEAEQMLAETCNLAEDCAIVLGSDRWHAGVVGIVAGKLARRHHRPVFVIAFDADGVGKGSGRSVEGVSLVQALDLCRDTLVKGGGHDMAAGLTLEMSRLAEFRTRFLGAVAGQIGGVGGLQARLWLDSEVALADLDFELLDAYERLEPFGEAHAAPRLFVRGVRPLHAPSVLKERHRRLTLHHRGTTLTAMWFDSADIPLPPPPWDVAFQISRGEWNGEERLDVHVLDVRAAAP